MEATLFIKRLMIFLRILLSSNFIVSCSNAQEDKVLAENKFMRTKVYQSDLDKYILDKNIKDTVQKSKFYVEILANAKARMYIQGISTSNSPKLSYNEILLNAEKFITLKNMVNKVLVIKSERKMYLQKDGKTIKTFPIALGPNPVGQKENEGDGKTPEGTYTLDWQRHETPTFHSFHVSYPNAIDSARAESKGLKPGSNIMVHGTSKGVKKKKDWTNGCIALSNADMTEFRRIVFQNTVIEIKK